MQKKLLGEHAGRKKGTSHEVVSPAWVPPATVSRLQQPPCSVSTLCDCRWLTVGQACMCVWGLACTTGPLRHRPQCGPGVRPPRGRRMSGRAGVVSAAGRVPLDGREGSRLSLWPASPVLGASDSTGSLAWRGPGVR